MFRYDRLDERIKETGKKKVYLCERLNRAPTYLRDAKKQNTNIKGEDLRILADELDTTPEYLTGETDQKEKSPAPEGTERIPGYSNLSETNKAIVDTMIAQLLAAQSDQQ